MPAPASRQRQRQEVLQEVALWANGENFMLLRPFHCSLGPSETSHPFNFSCPQRHPFAYVYSPAPVKKLGGRKTVGLSFFLILTNSFLVINKVNQSQLGYVGLIIQFGNYFTPPEFSLSVCLLAILLLIKIPPLGKKKR